MTIPDADLCQLLADDLSRYFDLMVTRFQQRLMAFAFRLTGSRPEAEDILQEAFLGAFVTLEHFPPDRIRALHLQAWLYKITLHAYHHQHRGARVQLIPLAEGEDAPEIRLEDATEDQPEQFIERIEQQQELLALLAELPDRYRIALTCYYFEHLSYHEIADLLDQPLGTVKSAIHRGLRQLRALLVSHHEGSQAWKPAPYARDH